MAKFTTSSFLAVLALSISSVTVRIPFPRSSPCMTKSQSLQVLQNWQTLLSAYSPSLADAALTKDFHDYSASAADLNNVCPQAPVASPPLDQALFKSREEFKGGQGQAKPIESVVLKHWYTCDTVIMRWKLTNLGSREVYGVVAFETRKAPKGNKFARRISTAYSEFDSTAWILNLQEEGKCNASNMV